MYIARKYLAEAFGTAVLVLMGCGAAVLAGSEIGYLGISFAFGLSVIAMAYTIGHISSCHINPAVTIGMCVSGRMRWSEGLFYIIAQTLGAVLGAALLAFLSNNGDIFSATALGQNIVSHKYSLMVGFIAELVMTFIFVRVILGVTDSNASYGNIAGVVIGLTLVLIHIVTIPLTGTSVNPARSFGPAILVQGEALGQLWLFWVAPLLGAILAGLTYKLFCISSQR